LQQEKKVFDYRNNSPNNAAGQAALKPPHAGAYGQTDNRFVKNILKKTGQGR
jgi:hypothetical protein